MYFTFSGLSWGSTDYTLVGQSCSLKSGRGMVGVYSPTGLYVPCRLGPPCKVKSNRFAVTRGYESLGLLAHRSKGLKESEMVKCDVI